MLEKLKELDALKRELVLLKSGKSELPEPYLSSEIASLEKEIQRLIKDNT